VCSALEAVEFDLLVVCLFFVVVGVAVVVCVVPGFVCSRCGFGLEVGWRCYWWYQTLEL